MTTQAAEQDQDRYRPGYELVADRLLHYIAEQGFDPVYGARPLRRFIAREVETKIGRALLAGDVRDGAEIRVDLADFELTVTYQNPT